MKFSIDSKDLSNALDSMQVRGKHLTTSGFGNSNIGSYVYMSLEDNRIESQEKIKSAELLTKLSQ